MNAWPTPLVCSGRDLDKFLQPVGDPCGAKFNPRATAGGWLVAGTKQRFEDLAAARYPTEEEQADQARSVGWSVQLLDGGMWAATCPKCRKPNPQLAADVRAIQQELLTRPDVPATKPTP
jgi:hypothetical protein